MGQTTSQHPVPPADLEQSQYAIATRRCLHLSDSDGSLPALRDQVASFVNDLSEIRRHAADVRVAVGLMRSVLDLATSSPLHTACFVETLLDVPGGFLATSALHASASDSTGSPTRHRAVSPSRRKSAAAATDDDLRHPVGLLVAKATKVANAALLEITVAWMEFLLRVTSIPENLPAELQREATFRENNVLAGSPTMAPNSDTGRSLVIPGLHDDDDLMARSSVSHSPTASRAASKRSFNTSHSRQPIQTAEELSASAPLVANYAACFVLLENGVLSLLHHVFTLQDTTPVSAITCLRAANVLRWMAEGCPEFMDSCLASPLVPRVLRRLRFTRSGTDERYALIDFLFAVASYDASRNATEREDSEVGSVAAAHNAATMGPAAATTGNLATDQLFDVVNVSGAMGLTHHALPTLPGVIDSLLACMVVKEDSLACVLRALRVLTSVCSCCTVGYAEPVPFTVQRLTRLAVLWERGPSAFRDLCRLYCVILNSDAGLLCNAAGAMPAAATASGIPRTLSSSAAGDRSPPADSQQASLFTVGIGAIDPFKTKPPTTDEIEARLESVYDIKLVERGDVDPVDLLQITDTAMQASAGLRGFVVSRLLATIVARTSAVALRVPRAMKHWLLLVRRIGSDSAYLADHFSSSGGLNILLGIIEGGASRVWVYEAVSAIQRLCTTDESRVRLLQQRNFHALLRTISPKGSGEQMLAASEAVAILKAMMTPTVLARADDYLVDAIHSLLCQALSHCPLVNPRTQSVDAAYIVAAQGVLQSVLELLLRRVRQDPRVTASVIYSQLPLDRLRELVTQPWYPVVQRTAKELISMFLADDARRVEIVEFNLLSTTEVIEADRVAGRRASVQQFASSDSMLFAPLDASDDGGSTLRREATLAMTSNAVAAAAVTTFQQQQQHRHRRRASSPTRGQPQSSTRRGSEVERSRRFFTIGMLRRVQRRWRLVLALRKMSARRVAMAALFKTAFLHYNDIVDREQREFAAVATLFDTHVNCIADQYRERQVVEDDANQKASILIPETAERCSLWQWFCEDLEVLVREQRIAEYLKATSQLKDVEHLWVQEHTYRMSNTNAERRAFDAVTMRHTQGSRGIDRLYDQRKHLERTEQRFRNRLKDEVNQAHSAFTINQKILHTQSETFRTRRELQVTALNELIEVRQSFYPVLVDAILTAERRQRDEINIAVTRLFAASNDTIQNLEIQHSEEATRQREERWALRVIGAFAARYYGIAIRLQEQRERATRARLWHAFCWQWWEISRGGCTLRLQADEDTYRTRLVNEAVTSRNIILEALRATLPLAWQATEVRARRALENVYALSCRYRAIEMRLLRLVWVEQQHRNAIAMQWFVGARNVVVPLSVLRLALSEETLWNRDVDHRSAIWMQEWHAFEAIKFDAVQREQAVRRREILIEHKVYEDELLTSFVSSTHVLAIQHAAKGYKPPTPTSPSNRKQSGAKKSAAASLKSSASITAQSASQVPPSPADGSMSKSFTAPMGGIEL
jgi:hypothetical protein